MKYRSLLTLVVLLACFACAPAEEPAPEPEPEAAPMDDEAAIDALRASYVEHYNMGHADMVADLFTDDATTLFADGGVNMGQEAIEASLTEAMAGNPTASIDAAETMVMGDRAVSRGTYSIDMAPEGAEPMSFGGAYMTAFERVDGEWKLDVVISNYNGPPAEGMPSAPDAAEGDEPAPEDLTDSPIADLLASYTEHFNMGHAGVVADLYSEDAVVAFADTPIAEGREAVEAALAARMETGDPQLALHQVAHFDLGDGWHLAGGWYETMVDGAPAPAMGAWVTVLSTDAEGNPKIHWAVTNLNHAD